MVQIYLFGCYVLVSLTFKEAPLCHWDVGEVAHSLLRPAGHSGSVLRAQMVAHDRFSFHFCRVGFPLLASQAADVHTVYKPYTQAKHSLNFLNLQKSKSKRFVKLYGNRGRFYKISLAKKQCAWCSVVKVRISLASKVSSFCEP